MLEDFVDDVFVVVGLISVLVVFVYVKGSRSIGGSGRLSSGAGYW